MSFEQIVKEDQIWLASLSPQQRFDYEVEHFIQVIDHHMQEVHVCEFYQFMSSGPENDHVLAKLIQKYNVQTVGNEQDGFFWRVSNK